ncbi:MAG: coproporphyrinogen dehydrogenase HemZ [Oscillospiraceae bacterium]|nr:coproporphyrinogen dehydrogenase HemZ [Oscillospiraceae bacterium]
MTIYMRGLSFRYDLEHLVRVFHNDVTVASQPMTGQIRASGEDYTYFRVSSGRNHRRVLVEVKYIGRRKSTLQSLDPSLETSELKRTIALIYYEIVSSLTEYYPPWGILTGVRPLKIVAARLDKKVDSNTLADELWSDYRIKRQKSLLAYEATMASKAISDTNTHDSCSVYISIPYCPSRCSYCSFVSHSVGNQQHQLEVYISRLLTEIEQLAEIISREQLKIRSIYIGGGTPTVLPETLLELLCRRVEAVLLYPTVTEYTVEAGRPDTITDRKLEILKRYSVNRISINPQTFDSKVLTAIGRGHTVEDIYEAFDAARRVGFDNINTDLIIGLPKDNYFGFMGSLTAAIALAPACITVHTLTLKRGSDLSSTYIGDNHYLSEAITNAYFLLKSHNFHPYYLYRQKSTLENLENIGYAHEGFESIYNVYIMEELHSIFSAGAGGVTKIVNQTSGHISRIRNYKYPTEYLKNFDEILRRKSAIDFDI